MKALLQSALLLSAIAGFAQSAAPAHPAEMAPASVIQPAVAGYRVPANETFVYDGEWRLWTAGQATLRVEPTGNTVKVIGTANSTGVVSLLYTVRDRFESYYDAKTSCSERVYKHTEEGSHKRDTNIRFDYARRKSVLDEKNLKKNETKHTEEDIPGCVTDVLSGIFYVGSLPLQVGSSYTFPLNDGGKVVDVKATVEAREQIKTPAGMFNTLRVRTEANSGPLKKRGSIWFWYTEDASRIPVQMRARAFWGTLTLRLIRTEKK